MHRTLKYNKSGFALVQDDILRFVHVPMDEELRSRLERGESVKVYAIFMERYHSTSNPIQ